MIYIFSAFACIMIALFAYKLMPEDRWDTNLKVVWYGLLSLAAFLGTYGIVDTFFRY